MHHAKCSSLLARWTLVLFVLMQAVAVLAPFAQRDASAQIVCSAHGGFKWVNETGEETPAPLTTHGLDCPLCVPAGGPPVAIQLAVLPSPAPQHRRLYARVEAPHTSSARAPLPARGPPTVS